MASRVPGAPGWRLYLPSVSVWFLPPRALMRRTEFLLWLTSFGEPSGLHGASGCGRSHRRPLRSASDRTRPRELLCRLGEEHFGARSQGGLLTLLSESFEQASLPSSSASLPLRMMRNLAAWKAAARGSVKWRRCGQFGCVRMFPSCRNLTLGVAKWWRWAQGISADLGSDVEDEEDEDARRLSTVSADEDLVFLQRSPVLPRFAPPAR